MALTQLQGMHGDGTHHHQCYKQQFLCIHCFYICRCKNTDFSRNTLDFYIIYYSLIQGDGSFVTLRDVTKEPSPCIMTSIRDRLTSESKKLVKVSSLKSKKQIKYLFF